MTSGSDLTLPGDIPGLLRRGSPIIVTCPESGGIHQYRPATDVRGIYGGARPGPHGDIHDVWLADRGLDALDALDWVTLDLADATGRAHATWWLARHYTVTRSPYDCVFTRVNGGWVLRCGYSDLAVWTYEVLGVDPDDRRSLPDGSSWLDAEALRIVAERAP